MPSRKTRRKGRRGPSSKPLKQANSIFGQLINALQGKSHIQGPVIKPMPEPPWSHEQIPYGLRGTIKSPFDPDVEGFLEKLDFSNIPKEPKEPKGPKEPKSGRKKGKK